MNKFENNDQRAYDKVSGDCDNWHNGDLASFGAETPLMWDLEPQMSVTLQLSQNPDCSLETCVVQKHAKEKLHLS